MGTGTIWYVVEWIPTAFFLYGAKIVKYVWPVFVVDLLVRSHLKKHKNEPFVLEK